jgi:hypothetical protein
MIEDGEYNLEHWLIFAALDYKSVYTAYLRLDYDI